MNPKNIASIAQSNAISSNGFPKNKLIMLSTNPIISPIVSIEPRLVTSLFELYPRIANPPKRAADPNNAIVIDESSKT